MSLFAYMQQTQRLLREQTQGMLDPSDLIAYINLARREIALRTQSVRVLPATSGSIVGVSITAAGTGYTSASATISAPDYPSGLVPYPAGLQATAGAVTIASGSITSIPVAVAGSGYFQPSVTITGNGTGATAVPVLSPILQTVYNQEVYPFTTADLTPFPGVGSIFAVHSISIIYAGYRYSIPQYAFSAYQSQIRNYPRQYTFVPSVCSQFGQGANGSLYMYPLPGAAYQMEWDCYCLPIDLALDTDIEAIPSPWTDLIPYFAAHLAYLELQNTNTAAFYLQRYEDLCHRYSAYARPGRGVNPYGRY